MIITPVFIILCILAAMGVAIFGIGICKDDADTVIGGIVILVVVAVLFAARSDVIEKEKLRELCITKGYKVEKVLGDEVCDI